MAFFWNYEQRVCSLLKSHMHGKNCLIYLFALNPITIFLCCKLHQALRPFSLLCISVLFVFLGGTYLCNSKRLLIKIQFLKFMEISHCFTSFYSHSAHSIYVCFPNGLVWPVNFIDLPFFKFFYRKWRRWHFRWGKSQLLRMVQIKWQNKSKRPILI